MAGSRCSNHIIVLFSYPFTCFYAGLLPAYRQASSLPATLRKKSEHLYFSIRMWTPG